MFHVSIFEFKKDQSNGGVAVIDPRTRKIVKILPVEGCHPAGIAIGPNGNFVLGCTTNGKEMPAITVIMNARSGAVVATSKGLGSADIVNFDAKNHHYDAASRDYPPGPVLEEIDAKSNKLVQMIPITGGNPNSVTSSDAKR
jgi:DNA-binding beta-propeller fold protein YncE